MDRAASTTRSCARGRRARSHKPAALKVVSPRTASPRQMFDTCGYCHGNKTNYFAGFRAGERYEDYALPFLISQPIPPEDPQGDFWPDGRPNRFNRPQAITSTGCFLEGKVTCTSCHVGHAARNDHALKVPAEQTNLLCTQCHTTFEGPALSAHTRHPADSAGSRCVECHMSDVNWRLLTRRRDHTFQPPVPEMTAAYGVPNACTTCHDTRTPEWAVETMNAWYGDGRSRAPRRRRAPGRCDVPRRQRRPLRDSRPRLRSLSRTRPGRRRPRERGRFHRTACGDPGGASAETLPLDAANALLKATADREPMVRAMAIRALGYAGERRAVPAISARLARSGASRQRDGRVGAPRRSASRRSTARPASRSCARRTNTPRASARSRTPRTITRRSPGWRCREAATRTLPPR